MAYAEMKVIVPEPEEAEPEEVPVWKWICMHCNRPFQTLPYFRKHERDCPTLPDEVSSDLCSFKFGSICQLTGHKSTLGGLIYKNATGTLSSALYVRPNSLG
jgi:hypothetical protein